MSQHRVTWEKDYAKSFRSRPGSDDWIVQCACGWRYSKHAYGPVHAEEIGDRHIRRATRSVTPVATPDTPPDA